MRRLSPTAAIDLQTHTLLSDGKWTPEALIQHFVAEGFALAAITDHDRPDTADALQALAHDHDFSLLVAAEMTSYWRGQLVDMLCYGFDYQSPPLLAMAEDVLRRQRENTQLVYDTLCQQGHLPRFDADELALILTLPATAQVQALQRLLIKHRDSTSTVPFSPGDIVTKAGCHYIGHDSAVVVDAIHAAGGVALLAHPGRGGESCWFDAAVLDDFRREIAIDGLEAHYPLHTPEQITQFVAYANQHQLLISSGSDSHDPTKPPIKYPAHLSRRLLERLGIQFEE